MTHKLITCVFLLFVITTLSSTDSFFSPPGEETASQHRWERRRGRRVGRGQRWWDGGRLQADERRCMYPVWSFPPLQHVYLFYLPELQACFVSLCPADEMWIVCVFPVLDGSCLNEAVVIKCCLSFLPYAYLLYCYLFAPVSFFCVAICSHCSSLFLFVPSSSLQLLLASFKVEGTV